MTTRIENDHYPTPQWMVDQLLKYAGIDGSVTEPCAGKDNAIANVLKRHAGVIDVLTNDLYFPDACDTGRDATDPASYGFAPGQIRPSDWIITNPPFGCQQPIIRNAYTAATVGVAMLLRVSADEMVMGDSERYNWWADHPESLVIKLPRFSFAKSSKTGKWAVDNTYCQWFIWRKDGARYDQPVIRIPHDRIDGFHRQPA